MAEVIYTVRRKFQYLGRWYKPGEIWEPAGCKWDKQIIGARALVTPSVPAVEKPRKAAPKAKAAEKAKAAPKAKAEPIVEAPQAVESEVNDASA